MADSLLNDDNHSSQERDVILNKWKDKPLEDVLHAKVESDLYINTLTARLDDLKKDYLELRERHQASTELKDLIDQIKSGQRPDDTTRQTQGDDIKSLKPEDVEALIEQRFTEKLTAHQRTSEQMKNFNEVQAKLKEHLGNNYQDVYKQRLDDLGLTKEFADDLAKNHPSVFLKTFEIDSPRQSSAFQAPPKSQSRPSSFAPQTPVRDWSYYQELKKTNPKAYLDPKIAVQMHNDAIALGERFGMPED